MLFHKVVGSAARAAANGTSFHQVTVNASYTELYQLFGEPSESGDRGYKVNHEWIFLNDKTQAATLYDWKQGQFGKDVRIDWHIGAQGHWGEKTPVELCNKFKGFVDAQLVTLREV